MPYFMRIVSGTGLHAGYLPGYPASHGCIRMPEFMAENFFRSVSVGTPVTITQLGRVECQPALADLDFAAPPGKPERQAISRPTRVRLGWNPDIRRNGLLRT